MNRETFVTLNKTRLFTADQVVDIVQSERDKVLDAVFASMDTFFGNIPMDSHIIQWAISKQDSFVTAAMATYLESRKLRQAGEP